MSKLHTVTAVLIGVLLLAGVGVAAFQLGQRAAVGSGGSITVDHGSDDPLAPLAELFEDLRERAVDVPDDEVLIEGAIEGMLDTLDDDYARYFGPEAFDAFQSGVDGEFVGIGVYLEETPEGATIVSVIPGTPAEEAGLEAGERIVSVDGEDVTDEPLDGITMRVQGEEGSDVTIGLDGGEAGEREVTLTRQRIDIPTVEVEVEDGLGIVRLLTFTSASGEQFAEAVEELVRQEDVEGLLLDVRSNGGGVLSDAVEVADVLLDSGPVVRVIEADGRERELTSSDDGVTDLPLVVLVNEGSASATEILAGALKDRERAELVGTTTFGKGTVQTISRFEDGSGAKFTTAEYFLPGGESIEGTGITPDREVEDPDEQFEVARDLLQQKVADREPATAR